MRHFSKTVAASKATWLHEGLLFVSLVMFAFHPQLVSAQDIKGVPAVPKASVNAGTVLSQFMNAVKPSSFTDGWGKEKSNWSSAVGKIKDAPGMISNITSLAKFIKPAMFKSGFSLESLMKTAGTAKTMADAGGLLKTLEGGMKPEAMVDGWAGKRNSWLSALSLLK